MPRFMRAPWAAEVEPAIICHLRPAGEHPPAALALFQRKRFSVKKSAFSGKTRRPMLDHTHNLAIRKFEPVSSTPSKALACRSNPRATVLRIAVELAIALSLALWLRRVAQAGMRQEPASLAMP
ncbi:MAG TPA: hypothetical protein VLB69_09820 [Rudaea sp.]|nr:hypothetical protein [Rudaea sp.]